MKLNDSQSKLARLRSNVASSSFSPLLRPSQSKVKEERIPARGSEGYRPHLQSPAAEQQPHSRPPLIIPAVRPMPTPPTSSDGRMLGRAGRSEAAGFEVSASVIASLSTDSSTRAASPFPLQTDGTANRAKRRAPDTPSPEQDKAMKSLRRKTG